MKPLVTLGLLAAGGLAGLADAALAQPGGLYVGVTGLAARPRVSYEKTVDNTDPANVSPGRGQVYRTDGTAAGAAYGAGFLAGYRLPLGAGGAYLSPRIGLESLGMMGWWRRRESNPRPRIRPHGTLHACPRLLLRHRRESAAETAGG